MMDTEVDRVGLEEWWELGSQKVGSKEGVAEERGQQASEDKQDWVGITMGTREQDRKRLYLRGNHFGVAA